MTGQERVASLRRIVTERNAQGKSVVAYDGPPLEKLEFLPGAGLFEIWSAPAANGFDHLPQPGPAKLLPLKAGVKCRWFTVLPTPPTVSAAELASFYDGAFSAMSEHSVRPDTTRHPGMHQTATLDFIIVIEGHVKLILDSDERLLGPGDVVVQRETNHAWVCVGDTPALLVAILLDRSSTT